MAQGLANTRVMTLNQISALVTNGDAFLAETPITFPPVSATVYQKGTPLSF